MGTSRIHSAYFYENEHALVTRLCRLVTSSLGEGRTTMLFLTREHKDQLESALRAEGLDLAAVLAKGQLKLLDAERLLQSLVADNDISEERFHTAFDNLLAEGAGSHRDLTVCGELVNLLWHSGRPHLAVKLEELWDAVLERHHLHLYCAYASATGEQAKGFEQINHFHGRGERARDVA